MRFEFATASRILFGPGVVQELIPIAETLGRRILVVSGHHGGRAAALTDGLLSSALELSEFHVQGEPTVDAVLSGVEHARSAGCDMIIGIGGGSVIDAGKAIAALASNPGKIYDYLEVVGKGQPLSDPSLPYITVPTTSGTGSEVTRNAVLLVPEKRVKVSLRSASMLPRVAIIDPQMTHGLPPAVSANSGMDALTQLIEPFLSTASNPMVDGICRQGIKLIARSLLRACNEGNDPEAREDMSLAALFSGIALANAKLGAVHGLAGPIGGMFPAPHGAVCAMLLPVVVQVNLSAMRERSPRSSILERFDELGTLLTDKREARAEAGVEWLYQLRAELQIPPLRRYRMTEADLPQVIAQGGKSSSMKGNPISLTNDELEAILRAAL